MAFCPNCGAAVEGRYCAKCGTAVDAPVTSSAPPVTTDPVQPSAPPAAPGLTENTVAALCYVLGLVTGIIFLVLEPYSRNKLIRFHAFQSIFMCVAATIIWWILGFAFTRFAYLMALIDLAFLVLWIYMIVQTYQGKKIVLPVIGDLAAKQA